MEEKSELTKRFEVLQNKASTARESLAAAEASFSSAEEQHDILLAEAVEKFNCASEEQLQASITTLKSKLETGVSKIETALNSLE